jgi:hypothetical protein
MNLIMLMLLSSVATLFAQTPEKLAPTFALAIEQKPLEAENAPGTLILLVKYANISNVVQQDCIADTWLYKMVVLRDGIPAERRTTVQSKQAEESKYPADAIRIDSYEVKTCGRIVRGIKPGESVKFPLWVSSAYDMTVPGTYDIAVTRETDLLNPEKSVTVKSNTLTIVVP